MNDFALDMYRLMFLSLKRGMSKGNLSSAKPILILSLIESVPYLKTNCFNVTNEFIKKIYCKNIKTFDPTSKTPLVIPFFHIHTEPFYEIL